jgi:hypothetical protein
MKSTFIKKNKMSTVSLFKIKTIKNKHTTISLEQNFLIFTKNYSLIFVIFQVDLKLMVFFFNKIIFLYKVDFLFP